MSHRRTLPAILVFAAFALATSAQAAEGEKCLAEHRAECFGLESVESALSTTEAGAHPDLTFSFAVKQDPESPANVFGLHESFAPVRDVNFDLPPGLIGDPNVLGVPQQCTVEELTGGGCPNGSQIGRAVVLLYGLTAILTEPVYMMAPPGGDVVARVGLIAGVYPTFVDLRVRSESDYGITATVANTSPVGGFVQIDNTVWGVPASPAHDKERCTPPEVLSFQCLSSPSRPPGSRPLPFLTNPTRCGVPLQMGVSVDSWVDPGQFDAELGSFPEISGCDRLPFGPSLVIQPTNRRAAAPTGLDVTARSPASDGVNVLEPSQTRDIRVLLPVGVGVNTSSADGLGVCSEAQAHFGERTAAECPDAAKMAEFEAEIGGLTRRMKGAIYLREPEPGNPFRIWAVANDLGAQVKLPGQLNIDKQSGQIESILLDNPQVPLREVKIVFKSGYRAPLVNPSSCGTYSSIYEFTPWSGGPPLISSTSMEIDEGCDTGGFSPKLSAGTTNASAGKHFPFVFSVTREDGEQNPATFDLSLPKGLVASFAGIPRCVGAAPQTGACPAGSRIGHVTAAVGAGPAPLWVPQPGKRPTAVYLGGPYKGAPLSIVAVVPRQAGPFDFGDEVVRSAIYVDPVTAQATARTDPLPQLIEGIPIRYRNIHVELDRPSFTLNPTGCMPKATVATVVSSESKVATASSPFEATNCSDLGLRPRISFRLRGGTRRGSHPALHVVLRGRPGDTNIEATSVALPHSEFLDQAHIGTVCTRVQFAAKACPPASIYGQATARSSLFDETLSGPVYLRSSSNPLPDVVVALSGPASLPIEVVVAGRVDSVNGGIRTSFASLPDAPVSSFTLDMQGGAKGLLVNSTNLCARTHRATVKFRGQNGRRLSVRPPVQAACGGSQRRARGRGGKAR